jgi:hypothetical protein
MPAESDDGRDGDSPGDEQAAAEPDGDKQGVSAGDTEREEGSSSTTRDEIPADLTQAIEEDSTPATGDDQEGKTDSQEWRFSVEEVGESNGNVAGSLDRDQPLEPQEITTEHAALVLLGVLVTVGLIASVLFSF